MAKSNSSTALEPRPEAEHSTTKVGDAMFSDEADVPTGPGLGRRIWDRWLKIAEVVGTIQMMIVLSIIYWVVLPFMAIPFRIFSDPLKLKRPAHSNWRERETDDSMSTLDSMGSQF